MFERKQLFGFLRRSRRAEPSPGSDAELLVLSDRGAVSEKTKGWPNQIFYEHGFPPFNTVWFSE